MVRTGDFQSSSRGSIPRGTAIIIIFIGNFMGD